MSFLDEILGVFPNAVQELKAHCIRLDVKDYDRVESLLGDSDLSSGLNIEWREAVFCLFDGIFAHFKFSHQHTDDRLDGKMFPVGISDLIDLRYSLILLYSSSPLTTVPCYLLACWKASLPHLGS